MRRSISRRWAVRVSLLSLPAVIAAVALAASTGTATGAQTSGVTTSSLGVYPPTFAGPASTNGLLIGPVRTSSTASSGAIRKAARPLPSGARHARMPAPYRRHFGAMRRVEAGTAPMVPSVNCPGTGCDAISTSSGGAVGVKGLNAVDSAQTTTNIFKDVEPPDQGLCAGNGYVVEANNIGEMMVFNTALARMSGPISLDAVMGLTQRRWSSGGDPSCEYDPSNGGHFFITEIVSKSPEQQGGAFVGCFAAKASSCLEGIAVSQGSNPFGPYYVYYLNANYNPSEPGYPYLLNDFAKIGVSRDAFLLFYDEFPLQGGGFGGGFFNGAQEFAFEKTALEQGRSTSRVNVAQENMGNIPTPDGTCAGSSGVDCWAAVIPGQPPDTADFDNANGGSGFMVDSLDFNSFAGAPSSGDNRIAAWAWTGLSNLTSPGCSSCSGGIQFSGDLFSNVESYYDPSSAQLPSGLIAPQKNGPIPLGQECGAAGLSSVASCPENGLATNGDFMTQVSQAQGQLWAPLTTQIDQQWSTGPEAHQGVAYYIVNTNSFDATRMFSLTNQGYVTAAHEELEMPAMAAEGTGGNGRAIILSTLSGNGGPTSADNGGFYPSTAYGRLTATSSGLLGSVVNVADLGQSPQDGFTEYQGYPGTTRPRWGDYSWGIYLPDGSDRIYFANEYIQYPNCEPPAFNYAAIGTCGGTRDGFANWGTSVNYVVP